jgi:molybdopterin synthase sulfur carrier subunit
VKLPLVRVRLFAGLREAMGWSERLVRVESVPATPLLLWRQLQLAEVWQAALGADAACRAAETATDDLPTGVRVAINQSFAAADTPLADGDELAFLPPISGG